MTNQFVPFSAVWDVPYGASDEPRLVVVCRSGDPEAAGACMPTPGDRIKADATLRSIITRGHNAVVTLTSRSELVIWIVCALGAGVAFFASHTMNVTAGTYWSGAVLLTITTFLFWMRFRRRQTQRTKTLARTSNAVLLLLTLVALLYLLGVATWYE